MNIKNYIGYIGYFCFARFLPKSNTRIVGRASKGIRGVFARMFIVHGGKNINIQRGAMFSRDLKMRG